jgi:hypothetical protein
MEKAQSYLKNCEEIHDFEMKMAKNDERFLEMKIKNSVFAVIDLGTFDFGIDGLGTFSENLYNPYLLRLEVEKVIIPDIAKIVVSNVSKAKYMLIE